MNYRQRQQRNTIYKTVALAFIALLLTASVILLAFGTTQNNTTLQEVGLCGTVLFSFFGVIVGALFAK